ncbi:MAG: carbohydrate ABC transporter permease [Clostridia bacterium]|jgi:multiple sugar transport system permease protein|nr:carbohydrate ABC transporter permease [Clostridia bacterium]MBR6300148.1 carbohydrate ABC transporter permease [Clostridia bacterium]
MQKTELKTGSWQRFRSSAKYNDRKSRAMTQMKNLLLGIFRFVIIVGISYVILAPVIGTVSRSFFSTQDSINPMVFTIPINPTVSRYTMAIKYMDYLPILGRTILYVIGVTLLQLLTCSMVGYGFARYKFPLKKLLFAFVVIMIVVPPQTIQFPLYMSFRYFGFGSDTVNLLKSPWPMVILSAFGCGLRSGLYIYIFNQFFRGLPKEIEEAALVDGANPWYTYFGIMLPNASPAIITVAVFSIVWQYNDSFFANTFNIPSSILITRKLDTLINVIANAEKINSLRELQLYFDAGVVLVLVPVVLIYLILQRRFIEGVERSGIVG